MIRLTMSVLSCISTAFIRYIRIFHLPPFHRYRAICAVLRTHYIGSYTFREEASFSDAARDCAASDESAFKSQCFERIGGRGGGGGGAAYGRGQSRVRGNRAINVRRKRSVIRHTIRAPAAHTAVRATAIPDAYKTVRCLTVWHCRTSEPEQRDRFQRANPERPSAESTLQQR